MQCGAIRSVPTINHGHTRVRVRVVMAMHVLALSCAPYLSQRHPEAAITSAWQCPTPSPVPTVLLRTEHEGGPPPTPEMEHRIYSTPVPTATPYFRVGTDFYFGQ